MDELDAYLYFRHERPLEAPPPRSTPRPPGEVRIATTDGRSLAASVWYAEPSPPERARTVVIASATGVKQTYYARFAAWLASRGFSVVTFDYRGIGGSRHRDVEAEAAMHDWGEKDLAAVVSWTTRRFGVPSTAVVGHSVGGQLVGLLPDPALVSSLVTVASQSGDYRLWPMPSRLAMAALWYGVVPGVTKAVGYLPGALGVGEDLPPGVALEWAAWCRTPGYLGASRPEGFARVRAPMLAFGFDDDPYAPPAAVDALLALYTNAHIERRQLSRTDARIGHFGFFRERHRALWRDVAQFLERR